MELAMVTGGKVFVRERLWNGRYQVYIVSCPWCRDPGELIRIEKAGKDVHYICQCREPGCGRGWGVGVDQHGNLIYVSGTIRYIRPGES